MLIFAYSGLINGLVALGFGIFVFAHNWRNKINQLYFLLALANGIWSFGYWQWQLSNDYNSALFWVRILSIGSTLIPLFYLHWIISLLGLNKEKKILIRLSYLIVFLFLIFSFSKLFIEDVRPKLFFPFWPDPGIIYHFYLAFSYILFVLHSIALLIKNYKNSPKEKKAQIIYVLVGSIIGFGAGATNFLLWYNIPIPPYGNFLVFLYSFFLGYAVLRYRLFDVRIVTTEVFIFLIWLILIINTILSKNVQDFLINGGILIAVFSLGIFLIRSIIKEVEQKEQMEKMAKEIQRAYEVEKKALEIETRARKELEKLDAAKDQFMSITQHNIRSPLTAMIGYLDLILEGDYGKVPTKIKEQLKRFGISARRLNSMVTEFMDVSKFQLGKEVVSLVPGVRIEQLLKEIMEEVEMLASQKNVQLLLEAPKEKLPAITADKERIKAALFNIVDNAVKYVKKDEGKVAVRMEIGNNKLKIAVKDNGIGIPKEKLSTVFNVGRERDETARRANPGGRGIGMFLSAKIVEAHHGKIWAESEGIGKGSTFYVELPLEQES